MLRECRIFKAIVGLLAGSVIILSGTLGFPAAADAITSVSAMYVPEVAIGQCQELGTIEIFDDTGSLNAGSLIWIMLPSGVEFANDPYTISTSDIVDVPSTYMGENNGIIAVEYDPVNSTRDHLVVQVTQDAPGDIYALYIKLAGNTSVNISTDQDVYVTVTGPNLSSSLLAGRLVQAPIDDHSNCYPSGYGDGYSDGVNNLSRQFTWNSDGCAEYENGYNDGYSCGQEEYNANNNPSTNPNNASHVNCYSDGYNDGYYDGNNNYSSHYSYNGDGCNEYDNGYNNGFAQGQNDRPDEHAGCWDSGYENGAADAYNRQGYSPESHANDGCPQYYDGYSRGYSDYQSIATHPAGFKLGNRIYFDLNGSMGTMDVKPFATTSGRTYVPLRYMAYILGINDANIIWNGVDRSVTLMNQDVIVIFTLDSTEYSVNGAGCTMEVSPRAVDNRVFLPARYVAEAFGCTVTWDAATEQVLISR